mmetsp:Transcript_30366/g.69626  ORF Transcript_30366/g.69626 Transcript_30366/m.69626 type:complete len:89 (+) Transcript_30366:170-436(+)
MHGRSAAVAECLNEKKACAVPHSLTEFDRPSAASDLPLPAQAVVQEITHVCDLGDPPPRVSCAALRGPDSSSTTRAIARSKDPLSCSS